MTDRQRGRWSPYRLPRIRRDMVTATRGAEGFADVDIRRDADRLLAAELYWVTREMAQLALDASADLPEWSAQLAAPARFGMLVWDGGLPTLPWTGAPDHGHRTTAFGTRRPPQVEVAGVTWWPDGSGGFEVSTLARTADIADLLAPRWQAAELFTFGMVKLSAEPIQHDQLHGNAAGLVAALGATWLLMQQPTIAQTRPLQEHGSGDGTARPPRPDREVRIIDLRPAVDPAAAREPNDAAGSGRVYRHRWLVRGHWRQQAVGQGRAQRRPVFVPAHIKGPDGAPMLESEHVRVWRR